MSAARRHHFVPQFYLREWHDPDGGGFWLYYRDRNGQIRLRRRPAKSVAYLDNLYNLIPDGLTIPSSVEVDLVETAFFSKVDHLAAKAHAKLLFGGLSSLDVEERSSFAIFLISLMLRHPAEIEKNIAHAQQLFPASPKNSLDRHRTLIRNTVLKTMVESIVDPRFVHYLLSMRWGLVSIPFEEEHFLTSDKPLLINGGKDTPDSPILLLSIALSPKKLLVLHAEDEQFNDDFVRTLAILHSPLTAERAEKHLISATRIKNGRFVQYEKIITEMLGTSNKRSMF